MEASVLSNDCWWMKLAAQEALSEAPRAAGATVQVEPHAMRSTGLAQPRREGTR